MLRVSFCVAASLLVNMAADMNMYVIAPRMKLVRKFIVRPAGDFGEAMLIEFINKDLDETGATVDNPQLLKEVRPLSFSFHFTFETIPREKIVFFFLPFPD